MTINARSHRSHAAAHASVGMTWLLNPAAAIDARRRTCRRGDDMAASVPKCLTLKKVDTIVNKNGDGEVSLSRRRKSK